MLRQLFEQFLPIEANLRTISFYETYRTEIFGGKSILVGSYPLFAYL
jgi:hypothetical protein